MWSLYTKISRPLPDSLPLADLDDLNQNLTELLGLIRVRSKEMPNYTSVEFERLNAERKLALE
jgi:hypothetical protein